ncbi:metallopeptidase [Decorospora gaudefroyi]|uniref:Metallopeptidase n=1 Tax=Decorospora gaudefroyi TaxID=184978 RepID=A0A6A5KFT6_9PLEO|nr:metallopeptidase [Decorospora gaudefroyi]
MVAADSPGLIDCPLTKAAGMSSAHADIDAAIAKLRMTAYMWQAMTAEDLRMQGGGRRSFRFDEEWTVDTISREFLNARFGGSLARDGAMRSTAKVHVIRSSRSMKEIRDANIAQQNPSARNRDTLFCYFLDALKEAGGPFVSDARPVVAGLILDSHYDASQRLILGHAALGRNNPNGISLGMFGSHLTYSWPRFLEEVTSCLTDTRAPGDKVGNDKGECNTMWEACAIGQGAHLHQIGHAFGSSHGSRMIQGRYGQDWPKNFLSKTAYSGHLRKEGVLVGIQPIWNNARWDLADVLAFRSLPHFNLPTDPPWTDEERNAMPIAYAEYETDDGPAKLVISSASGIVRLTFNHHEVSQALGWLRNPPKRMQYTETQLEQRTDDDRTKPLHLQILAFNGKVTDIKNIWKLFHTRTFINIPDSTLRLTKRLAFTDDDNTSNRPRYEWSQLLREKGQDGVLHRAISIDLRVGSFWDGGVIKYADDHESHWGPMRVCGRTHRFGGHASQKIELPADAEIKYIEVNPGQGVRVHLSDGTSAGELKLSESEQAIKLQPSPNEVIVGFCGKSEKTGDRRVVEFGIITVSRNVRFRELPDAVWDMLELKNTAGMNPGDDYLEGSDDDEQNEDENDFMEE